MSGVDEAVEALSALGLTQYEAKCFTALTRLSRGTAREVSEVADVPRSRVYDTLERLHDRGLVDVQESEPREYRAVEEAEAMARLESAFETKLEGASSALSNIETRETLEERGVWAVADHDQVTDRLSTLIEGATGRVHYLIATDRVVEDAVARALDDAMERGVDVLVEVPTGDVGETVRERFPGAEVVVAPGLSTTEQVERKWPGQLLMVDDSAVLASGVEEGDLPDVTRETAVWTTGVDHGFAAWTRELLADRVDGDRGGRPGRQ